MTELELIRAAQAGDRQAADEIVRRYTGLAFSIGARFHIPGGDFEDVRQESLIGLLRALRAFNGTGSFFAFAGMCITRHLSTRIRQAQALKHEPLTRAMRVIVLENEEVDAPDAFTGPRAQDPHLTAVDNERIQQLIDGIKTLTPTEREVLLGFANGMSYRELGPKKRVDNAMQRAKKKLAA